MREPTRRSCCPGGGNRSSRARARSRAPSRWGGDCRPSRRRPPWRSSPSATAAMMRRGLHRRPRCWTTGGSVCSGRFGRAMKPSSAASVSAASPRPRARASRPTLGSPRASSPSSVSRFGTRSTGSTCTWWPSIPSMAPSSRTASWGRSRTSRPSSVSPSRMSGGAAASAAGCCSSWRLPRLWRVVPPPSSQPFRTTRRRSTRSIRHCPPLLLETDLF
mmetsp:Transcript_126878/g.405801  ORF Transcript_126878/g.405801 Transcript_126878/m.405801 type:complete len:218 (+) Transcript_126878:623-1276(+)